MPRGDEEEIAVRDEGVFRFVALLATRALLERPTLNPSLIRHGLNLMASVVLNRPALVWELRPRLRTYANLVADARFQFDHPAKYRLRAEGFNRRLLRPTDRSPQHNISVRLSDHAAVTIGSHVFGNITSLHVDRDVRDHSPCANLLRTILRRKRASGLRANLWLSPRGAPDRLLLLPGRRLLRDGLLRLFVAGYRHQHFLQLGRRLPRLLAGPVETFRLRRRAFVSRVPAERRHLLAAGPSFGVIGFPARF